MTIWGCKTGLVKDDSDNFETREILLKQYPDAVEMDRNPSKYEEYIHGEGHVVNKIKQKEFTKGKAKQKLKETMSSGCEWNGYTFGCDETDRKRFQEGLVLLDLMQFENCNVWTMDNTKVTVTAAEYRQLCTAIAMTFAGAFEAYKDETSI